MRSARLTPALLAVVALAALAAYLVPRGLDAGAWLAVADDPVRLADRALDDKFNADLATREINAALEAKDADLAQSFVDLAAERQVALDPALIEQVKGATAEAASAKYAVASFAQGLISGEPKDGVGLAGTALGDLFVFGDIRDAVREGGRLASGEQADELVLGLACVGLAITAGTYASAGAAAPARVGLTLAKVARKTGQLGGELAVRMGRLLRGVVDWGQLRRAAAGASLAEPAVVVRAARAAVKLDRAGALVDVVRDVGRVEAKVGMRGALEGLKVAETPRDVARVAKLAEKEGSKTRAILKTLGRGAIALSVAAFDLGTWVLGALLTVLAFVSSLKSATERLTLRALRRRKERRRKREAAALAVSPVPAAG